MRRNEQSSAWAAMAEVLRIERDDARLDMASLRTELAALHVKHDALRAERDALREERDAARVANDAFVSDCDAALALHHAKLANNDPLATLSRIEAIERLQALRAAHVRRLVPPCQGADELGTAVWKLMQPRHTKINL